MDIFFKMPEDINTIVDIMNDAQKRSFKIFIDKHDDNGVRRKYGITYDKCIKIFKEHKDHMHWVFILRRTGTIWVDNVEHSEYWEIGGCTLGIPDGDVFLFINTTVEEGFKIKQNYELKLLGTYSQQHIDAYETQEKRFKK